MGASAGTEPRGEDLLPVADIGLAFDDGFARALPELCRPWQPRPVSGPQLVVLNEELAECLGADPDILRSPQGVAVLAGNAVPASAHPVAQAYAGHQFGGFSPLLGDGRALLLGEVVDPQAQRWDMHLKGSGPTPFARRGDGRAALGPMLREYLVAEAMHALGVPTSRMLAVVATGDAVMRQVPLPGAVLTRVAASHLRIGTFQLAAQLATTESASGAASEADTEPDTSVLRRLADYAIARHHPDAASADNPYLALLAAVVEAQASLVAQWMGIGFIHGVLNTDNVTIAGETIDYGPCAFMDRFDPATVYSSIDDGGRYAFGNQPAITQWNLTRLAEALLPLLGDNVDDAVASATEVLNEFSDRYNHHWTRLMRTKLGYGPDASLADPEVIDDLPAVMRASGVDHTNFFRALSSAVGGNDGAVLAECDEPGPVQTWLPRWRAQLPGPSAADVMDAVNPVVIPRNHLVEAALEAADDGDLSVFTRLLDVLADPFTAREGLDGYRDPAPADAPLYRTFCGT